MKNLSLLAFAFAGLLFSCNSFAGPSSFRCKNDLVNVGDSQSSALVKCGEPMARNSFCKQPKNKTTTIQTKDTQVEVNAACENVDEWTYNPGTGEFYTTLRFSSGKLISISYGDRVN